MFTGIVTDIGRVSDAIDRGGVRRLQIETAWDLTDLVLGASVSHAGCCLTVVDKADKAFAVELSNETLARTTLGGWSPGTRLNLERALRVGEELGGHLVTGHVDGVGEVADLTADGGSRRISIRAPEPLHRYIAAKGSITVDGVSLTVNGVQGRAFDVAIIPHTLAVTTLGSLNPGDKVNLEIDVMARYAARWRETQ